MLTSEISLLGWLMTEDTGWRLATWTGTGTVEEIQNREGMDTQNHLLRSFPWELWQFLTYCVNEYKGISCWLLSRWGWGIVFNKKNKLKNLNFQNPIVLAQETWRKVPSLAWEKEFLWEIPVLSFSIFPYFASIGSFFFLLLVVLLVV